MGYVCPTLIKWNGTIEKVNSTHGKLHTRNLLAKSHIEIIKGN